MSPVDQLFTLSDWRAAYQAGARPAELLGTCVARLAADTTPWACAWIWRADAAWLDAELARLATLSPSDCPLWGIPFAVKDNIDVAGLPTTAACPAFAYTAAADATVVQRLRSAGAVLLGKTNLDQFATGLVGSRSPYGAVPNSVDPAFVSGGSSSGSAVVVARGLVPFALGTDTAGSGRVPAAFNNLVGIKPTPGRLDMAGVLPACKSLDVVSVFALTVADGAEVAALIDGPAPGALRMPPLQPARLATPLRLGVPQQPVLDAGLGYPEAWAHTLAQAQAMGASLVPIDMAPLDEVAALLYNGPWVAERYSVVRSLLNQQPEALDATVRGIVEGARRFDAAAAFEARYRLEALAEQVAPMWQQIDALLLPSVPTHPTLAEVAAQPLSANSALGRYTNFVNLLGWAALALPAGFTARGLPFGLTLIGPGGADAALTDWGMQWEGHCLQAGVTPPVLGAGLRALRPEDSQPRRQVAAAPTLALAVVGAHLHGLPLHGQLQERGCRLRWRGHTAPRYRLHALPGTVPPKPGLARVAEGETGHAIALEVYDMPLAAVGSFLALIPPPLGLGSVELADGQWVKGFICEPAALHNAPDISAYGGWRAYMQAQAQTQAHPTPAAAAPQTELSP